MDGVTSWLGIGIKPERFSLTRIAYSVIFYLWAMLRLEDLRNTDHAIR